MLKSSIAVILASGPSLDGFNYDLLKGFYVVAINDAGLIQYPDAHTLISTDLRWWQSVYEGKRSLAQSKAKRIISTELPRSSLQDERVIFKLRERKEGLSSNCNVLHGRFTGVHSAINLAVHEGKKAIVLLGVDLKTAGQRKYTYGGHKTIRTARQFSQMYYALKSCVDDLKARGVKVYNGSPDSALDFWPKFTPEGALQECLK